MVAILEVINDLEVFNLEALCDCTLFNYGVMRDLCNKFTYNFKSGKVYGIIGEFGTGGWALSYSLAGKQKDYNGVIKVNGNVVDYKILKGISCYVGEGIESKKLFGKKNTIIEQLDAGLKSKKNNSNNIEYIIQLFELSKERTNRIIEHISNERWKASIAIGYAYGKQIYCFPWLNSGEIMFLKEHIKLCIGILRKNGAIVIIPTCKEKSIMDIVDETIYIKGLYEGMFEKNE